MLAFLDSIYLPGLLCLEKSFQFRDQRKNYLLNNRAEFDFAYEGIREYYRIFRKLREQSQP